MEIAGESFDITKDSNLLKLYCPKASFGGFHKVIYKSLEGRWVIVGMDWDGEPRLAMTWFLGTGGNPFSI